ncbi:MAG: hypothetical protein COC01_00815 [Bacteroidetes bacterium]|nr:MAG: hypothetical protein COC01_00815 [Bacteroidota bacterium]
MKHFSPIIFILLVFLSSCVKQVPEGKYKLKEKRGLNSLVCGASRANLGNALEVREGKVFTTPMQGITGARIYNINQNEKQEFFIEVPLTGKESKQLFFEISEYKEILFKCGNSFVIYEFESGFAD